MGLNKRIGRENIEVNINSPKEGHVPVFNEGTRLWDTEQLFVSGNISGSFVGDGSGLYNIPTSGVTGLEDFAGYQIASGSVTASISPNNGLVVNTDTTITGSLNVTGDIKTEGNIIAQQYIVSSSVIYVTTSFSSGSNIFGNTLDDTHQFTGSVNITGSFFLNGTEFTSDSFRFQNDLIVSLSGSKTFGRYPNGATIPASGKTAAEVIILAIQENIAPTVSLTSPTTISFNQTAISNVLNFSYTINTLNATVSSVLLEWRRNNSGAWTGLTTNVASTTYTHTLTDTNFNTEPFNYRYTVNDSSSGTTIVTLDITPAAYIAPTITLNLSGTTLTSPEIDLNREKGNVSSGLYGTIVRNSSNVDLVSYQLQYRVNSGSWTNLGSSVSIGPGNSSITLTNHNDITLINSDSISYRVEVIDTYQQNILSSVYSSLKTINFLRLIFYGPSSTNPTTSTDIRNLNQRIFTNGVNPVTLNTGNIYNIFAFAAPTGTTINEVLDLDALNANITSNYVLNSFSVQDFGGTNTNYNVYVMTNAIPYSSNHRHQINRV